MDKYSVVSQLGQGAQGRVFLAKERDAAPGLDVNVVIKVIPVPAGEDERTACLREAMTMGGLHHPAIVRCKESFLDEDNNLCIVMEHCNGGDLATLMEKRFEADERFPEAQVVQWFAQLALALEYMHKQGVLHRDLKSENVFLRDIGDGRVIAQLGDFGIARLLDGPTDLARTFVGTPYYMSPEIFLGEPYSFKSDVWAIGCVMYEMLTLRHAFEAANLNNLAMKVIQGKYVPMPSQYSKDLTDAVTSMLVKDPSTRPSAAELLALPVIRSHAASFLASFNSPTPTEVSTPVEVSIGTLLPCRMDCKTILQHHIKDQQARLSFQEFSRLRRNISEDMLSNLADKVRLSSARESLPSAGLLPDVHTSSSAIGNSKVSLNHSTNAYLRAQQPPLHQDGPHAPRPMGPLLPAVHTTHAPSHLRPRRRSSTSDLLAASNMEALSRSPEQVPRQDNVRVSFQSPGQSAPAGKYSSPDSRLQRSTSGEVTVDSRNLIEGRRARLLRYGIRRPPPELTDLHHRPLDSMHESFHRLRGGDGDGHLSDTPSYEDDMTLRRSLRGRHIMDRLPDQSMVSQSMVDNSLHGGMGDISGRSDYTPGQLRPVDRRAPGVLAEEGLSRSRSPEVEQLLLRRPRRRSSASDISVVIPHQSGSRPHAVPPAIAEERPVIGLAQKMAAAHARVRRHSEAALVANEAARRDAVRSYNMQRELDNGQQARSVDTHSEAPPNLYTSECQPSGFVPRNNSLERLRLRRHSMAVGDRLRSEAVSASLAADIHEHDGANTDSMGGMVAREHMHSVSTKSSSLRMASVEEDEVGTDRRWTSEGPARRVDLFSLVPRTSVVRMEAGLPPMPNGHDRREQALRSSQEYAAVDSIEMGPLPIERPSRPHWQRPKSLATGPDSGAFDAPMYSSKASQLLSSPVHRSSHLHSQAVLPDMKPLRLPELQHSARQRAVYILDDGDRNGSPSRSPIMPQLDASPVSRARVLLTPLVTTKHSI
eukprot:jgi/Chlat1/2265/Chrsp17S02573